MRHRPQAPTLERRATVLAALRAALGADLGAECRRDLPNLAKVRRMKQHQRQTEAALSEIEGVLRVLNRGR